MFSFSDSSGSQNPSPTHTCHIEFPVMDACSFSSSRPLCINFRLIRSNGPVIPRTVGFWLKAKQKTACFSYIRWCGQVLASEESRSIYSWAVWTHWSRGATCRAGGEKHHGEKKPKQKKNQSKPCFTGKAGNIKRMKRSQRKQRTQQDHLPINMCDDTSLQEFCQIPFAPVFSFLLFFFFSVGRN